jgi:hypothetical protein
MIYGWDAYFIRNATPIAARKLKLKPGRKKGRKTRARSNFYGEP